MTCESQGLQALSDEQAKQVEKLLIRQQKRQLDLIAHMLFTVYYPVNSSTMDLFIFDVRAALEALLATWVAEDRKWLLSAWAVEDK